jgi:hypothetical protein
VAAGPPNGGIDTNPAPGSGVGEAGDAVVVEVVDGGVDVVDVVVVGASDLVPLFGGTTAPAGTASRTTSTAPPSRVAKRPERRDRVRRRSVAGRILGMSSTCDRHLTAPA